MPPGDKQPKLQDGANNQHSHERCDNTDGLTDVSDRKVMNTPAQSGQKSKKQGAH
ncbi:MAG: hypothetical protein FalmKO_44770 [Falsiruegeria mediterranea]